MADSEIYWVRLRRRNERKGIKLRRFSAFGLRFEEGKNWYKVPEVVFRPSEETKKPEKVSIIDYLRQVRNDNDDPESPIAFDICSREEAFAMDEAERRALEAAKAMADAPNEVDFVSTEQKYTAPVEEPTKYSPQTPVKRKPGRPKKIKAEKETM